MRRIGGGYGGKATPSFFIACATAVASWKVNKPVSFVMDLKTNSEFTGKRGDYLAKYKAGVDSNGLIQFVDITFNTDVGWSSAEGLSIGEVIPFAQNAYNSASWNMTPIGVITDKARATACRAPGSTQGHAIIENIMDHLAAKLEMDPLEFRLKNFLKEGDLMLHGGHKFSGTNPLPDMIGELSKSSAFEERKKAVETFNQNNKWKKRGMSCVPVRYGVSLPPFPNYCHISVYQNDGTISVSHGGIEMGQGINTKVAQTVAKCLDVPMEMIIVKPADALVSPNNICTGGSTTSEAVCNVSILKTFHFLIDIVKLKTILLFL